MPDRAILLLLLGAATLLPARATAQSYADRNLSLPQGGNEGRRPIVILSPIVPAAPAAVPAATPTNGPVGSYASEAAGPDIRARNANYVTQFRVVGTVPPGSTISKVSWRYTVSHKPPGFEALLCWQDAGSCWHVTDANTGSTDFFNGRDASKPFQLYYRVRARAAVGEAPIKGEINQIIVTYNIPG